MSLLNYFSLAGERKKQKRDNDLTKEQTYDMKKRQTIFATVESVMAMVRIFRGNSINVFYSLQTSQN